jgi:hydrogenase expression/formation protein HypC
MCLAIPAKVITILEKERAIVNLGGVKKEISLSLLDHINEGDYVVIHVGYAIARLDESEAQKTLAILSELAAGMPRTVA